MFSVEILDHEGLALPPTAVRLVRQQQGEFIGEWLEEQTNKWNLEIESILNIHLDTPSHDRDYAFEMKSFDQHEPIIPKAKSAGILGLLFKGRKESVTKETRLPLRHTNWI